MSLYQPIATTFAAIVAVCVTSYFAWHQREIAKEQARIAREKLRRTATCGSPTSGSRTRAHAFTHGTSCPKTPLAQALFDGASSSSPSTPSNQLNLFTN
jgi:hypothetical protein